MNSTMTPNANSKSSPSTATTATAPSTPKGRASQIEHLAERNDNEIRNGEKKKNVRFCATPRVVTVPSCRNLPMTEKIATWYNLQELNAIHKDVVLTVAAMRQTSHLSLSKGNSEKSTGTLKRNNGRVADSKLIHEASSARTVLSYFRRRRRSSAGGEECESWMSSVEDSDTTRGLEDMRSLEAWEERNSTIELAVSSVLEEQTIQRQSQEVDPIRIANASAFHSRVSVLKARYLAEKDKCASPKSGMVSGPVSSTNGASAHAHWRSNSSRKAQTREEQNGFSLSIANSNGNMHDKNDQVNKNECRRHVARVNQVSGFFERVRRCGWERCKGRA